MLQEYIGCLTAGKKPLPLRETERDTTSETFRLLQPVLNSDIIVECVWDGGKLTRMQEVALWPKFRSCTVSCLQKILHPALCPQLLSREKERLLRQKGGVDILQPVQRVIPRRRAEI